MKKIYTFLILLLPFTMMAQTNYSGNGGNGFGGTIGAGSLNVTDDGTNISFVLTRGTGNFTDVLVIYIDNKLGGGFASTAGFADANDGLRRAISGFDGGSNRSVMNFPSSFRPQFAISAGPVESFGGLWELANGGNMSLVFKTSVNLTPSNIQNATTYTMTVAKAAIGITGAINFNFLATYISTTGFRADEGIGFADPGNNPGHSNISVSSFFSYPSGVLPLSILNLERAAGTDFGKLFFTTSDETDVNRFEVEASYDAVNWEKIASINSRGSQNGSRYDVLDTRVIRSTQFYRVRAVSFSGEIKFSNVVKISDKNEDKISLTTNFVQSQLVFNMTFEETSRINISIVDMSGRVVTQQAIPAVVGFSQQKVSVGNLATGMYIAVFDDSKGYKLSVRFIKQ